MAQQECPEGVVSYSVLPVDGGDGGGDGVRLHEPGTGKQSSWPPWRVAVVIKKKKKIFPRQSVPEPTTKRPTWQRHNFP